MCCISAGALTNPSVRLQKNETVHQILDIGVVRVGGHIPDALAGQRQVLGVGRCDNGPRVVLWKMCG